MKISGNIKFSIRRTHVKISSSEVAKKKKIKHKIFIVKICQMNH